MGKAPKDDGFAHEKTKGRWVQWLDLGRDEAGRRIRKKVSGKTRNDVRNKIRDLRARHSAGMDIRKKGGSVEELTVRYLAGVDGRPRTLASYRYLCRRFIIPKLGTRPVPKVTYSELQAFLVQLRSEPRLPRGNRPNTAGKETPIASGTIGLVRTVLIQVFEVAVKDGTIAFNPAKRTDAIRIEETPRQALTDSQVAELLHTLQGHRLEMAVKLLLKLGLRRGECAALKLDDLDLESRTLRIDETSGYVAGVGMHTGPTKTKSGHRTLPLSTGLAAELAWYLRQRETEQRTMNWPNSPWLFRSIDGGRQLNSSAIYEAFGYAAHRAELVGFSPHSLRHSAATFLKSEGVSLKEIATILGHSSIAELDRYLHTMPGEQEEALEKLDERLKRSSKKKRASGE